MPGSRVCCRACEQSPSDTYVAICNTTNFDGFYCRKFTIPAHETPIEPGWYFLNRLNLTACLQMVMTWEDYSDLSVMQVG